jgi:hypothetical protein
MLAKAKSMMSKLVAKPLAEMLVKAVLLIAKVDGEAPCQYVGEGVVGNVKIGVGALCQKYWVGWC